ncbi:hypothetical protein ADL06_13495 [Streptomyces sp. NRRL F-6491]|nr:hypothetical protein ADL06_13495 [Streptomyces sp. NRRL F-6491]KOX41892.1 hypothetical protein ADL08_17565 [Streptomyces sp. NRRL F-6492]
MPPVLLVDGLAAHAQLGRDLLPRPALGARTAYLNGFQLFQETPQRGDGTQSDSWIAVTRPLGEIGRITHDVNLH